MALPSFTTFFPTVRRWINTSWRDQYKLIVDNDTGTPVGIQSQNSTGPEGMWGLTPLSVSQIASPTAAMLADLNATYQSDTAPYGRYRSDGSQLVSLDSEGGTVIPPGFNEIVFSPLVVTENHPLTVQGGLRVIE